MVFGPIKRTFRWHRWVDLLRSIRFVIAVDVDMNTLLANIMAEFAFDVVIVPNNEMPLAFVFVFQLDDETRNLSLRPIVS
jgi:hypothetical protein